MRLSHKIYLTLLLITGVYLCLAAVRFFGPPHYYDGFLAFTQTLPGLGRHASQGWKNILRALFALNWMYFWMKLTAFMESRKPASVAFISLLFFIFFFFSHHSPVTQSSRLVHHLSEATVALFFFPVLVGNALLFIGSILGFERVNLLQEELEDDVIWPKKVRHAQYLKKASDKSLTYLGFEVTRKEPIFLSPLERNSHIQVIGTTGSGKTLFTLFPLIRQDIEAGRGIIFIDAKGSSENASTIYDMVRHAGREKDFHFFSLTQTSLAGTYNPLQHGNPSQLKDKIAASIEWSEPYYQRICESALQALFMDLEAIGRRVTLLELREILRNPPAQLPNFSVIADQNSKDIRTLFSEIDLLVNTPFGALFGEQEADIDLLDGYQKGKILYFGLDTQSYLHTAARVGKMITQDINTLSGIIESSFSASEKRPMAIYIDEFQAFGTRGFINALARGRSSGFWITIAHQSLGDLKAIDEAFAQQVIENTNTKVILRVNDPETAQFFADSVGTIKTIKTTGQILLEGQEPTNIMGSQRVVHEYQIHPGEFKGLDTGQAMFKSGKRSGRICLHGHFPRTGEMAALQVPPPKKSEPQIAEEKFEV